MSGIAAFCRSGSPPVSSTSGQRSSLTRDTTSSTDIFLPPEKAYGVSHQAQRRSQAARRTNVQGRPACVDSP